MKTIHKTIFQCLLSAYFFSILDVNAQLIELNGYGINQPYTHLPPSIWGTYHFTIGSSVYQGMGVTNYGYYPNSYNAESYSYDVNTGNWSIANLTPTITPRAYATTFSYSGKAYVGLGTNGYVDFDDIWEIDVQSGVATQKASFPTIRNSALSFIAGNRAYVGGGGIGMVARFDLFSYDFATNTWLPEPLLPALYATSSSYPLVLEIDGEGYLLFCRDSSQALTHPFLRYDRTSQTWINMANYPGTAWGGLVGFGFNDQGFVGFGSHGSQDLSEFYQYDPLNNTWTQKNSFTGMEPYSRGFSNGVKAGAIGVNGHVFEYDIVSDSWAEKVGKPITIIANKMIVVNNKAYGRKTIYDIATDTWTIDSSLNVNNWYFEIGGVAYAYANAFFSRFDPATMTFTPVAQPPSGLITYFSIGGKGYAGDFSGTPTNGFWEYDPVADQWTRKADFTGPTRDCGGGFGIGDKGYILGGWCDSIGWYIYDFWEYNPQNDQWTQKADGPTGYLGSIMAGDATRGYVGLGIWDGVGTDNGGISAYDPVTDTWAGIAGIYPRHNSHYFIANDALYVGGGFTRLSNTDFIRHYDSYKIPLAGINFVEDLHVEASFEVFPNPTTGIIFLKNIRGKRIDVYDQQGKKVYSLDLKEKSTIDLGDNLNPGCYFISDETGRTKKIIVLAE